MKVILPVAGSGTRLRPLTHTTTKSLLMVGNRRMLGHLIDNLKQIIDKIDSFIFITDKNNKSHIEKYVEKYFPDYNCEFIIQEEKSGPAHAVWLAKQFINKDDDVLVVFNDTLFVVNLTKIFTEYNDCGGLIYSCPTNDPQRFGIILCDKNNNIIDMIEKPQHDVGSNLAVVGMYYVKNGLKFMNAIEYTIKNNVKERGEFYLNIPLKMMMEDGDKFKAPQLDDWLDCGKKETLLETNKKLLQKFNLCNYSEKYKDCIIIPPAYIDEKSKISNSIIGPNVSVGGNAEISDSVVMNSIINPGAKVNKMLLKESLIGENAEIKGAYCSSDLGDDCKIDLNF